jgi:uncharacterized lipoprotein
MLKQVGFKLVERAAAQGRVAAVGIKINVEAVSYLQPGFFEAGKGQLAAKQERVAG